MNRDAKKNVRTTRKNLELHKISGFPITIFGISTAAAQAPETGRKNASAHTFTKRYSLTQNTLLSSFSFSKMTCHKIKNCSSCINSSIDFSILLNSLEGRFSPRCLFAGAGTISVLKISDLVYLIFSERFGVYACDLSMSNLRSLFTTVSK